MLLRHTPQCYNVCLYSISVLDRVVGRSLVYSVVRAVPPSSTRIDFGVGIAAPSTSARHVHVSFSVQFGPRASNELIGFEVFQSSGAVG